MPPQNEQSFIFVHGSHKHLLFLIYALLLQIQLCCDYALLGGTFGQNLVGGGTTTFYRTGARSYNLTPTAPMGGGTQLFEGAHLTGAIRAFVANQANVAITGFLLL